MIFHNKGLIIESSASSSLTIRTSSFKFGILQGKRGSGASQKTFIEILMDC